jgi:hypothetical protein
MKKPKRFRPDPGEGYKLLDNRHKPRPTDEWNNGTTDKWYPIGFEAQSGKPEDSFEIKHNRWCDLCVVAYRRKIK